MHVANPMESPLDRSYAQKLRTDRDLSFESATARSRFWATQQAQLVQVQQSQEDNLNAISQGTLRQTGTQIQSANIESTTLNSTAPVDPSQAVSTGVSSEEMVGPPAPK